MLLRAFDPSQTEDVVGLWELCGLTRPWNDPRLDIRRKLGVQPELFLVGFDGDSLVATAMAGYDGHRGWVNYLAVHPDARGRGYGRQITAEIERMLEERGCPKLSLQIRTDNEQALGFYRALGYAPDAVVSMGKRLIED